MFISILTETKMVQKSPFTAQNKKSSKRKHSPKKKKSPKKKQSPKRKRKRLNQSKIDTNSEEEYEEAELEEAWRQENRSANSQSILEPSEKNVKRKLRSSKKE